MTRIVFSVLIAGAFIALLTWRYTHMMSLNRELYRFRAMIERNSDLISVVAGDGTVSYVSPSALHFLGERPEQVIGKHLTKFVHPDDLEMIGRLWEEVLSEPGKVLHTPEFRLVWPDGSIRYAESVGCNMMDDPAVAGVLANTHDVTDRRIALDKLRAAEDQFRQAQKMEAVGRLAGGVAHDFNNLLTAIQGYTRLLLDDERLEASMRADLEQVQAGADRAAAITRQLLAYSRRQMVQPQVVELTAIIDGVREMVRGLAGPAITTRFDLSADTGFVRADPGQIEQVLLNLVINAHDAMPDGGRIGIATRRVIITADEAAQYPYEVRPGDYAELTVTDSGTGIPPDVLPNIFEPFFTTKPLGKATGLGLATVYGVVKQSGGHVWVRSEDGVGTTFRICLPHVTAPAPPSRPHARPADGGGGTILVVEDEHAVRRLTTRILERAGYTVLAAADGEVALDLCAQYTGPLDLVVTDVVMPGLNGRDVVKRLRCLRPGLKALFVSGYSRDAIIEQGFVDPDIEFMEKPFAPDALVQKVRDVIDTPART